MAQMNKRSYFGAARRGELAENRAGLNSNYVEERKDAIKRVIANMTVGKDVSGLFPDVLKNMQTEDIEQKKLVYLYLINYAKTQPELVILAVNTFVKDTSDPNPLIRALAIRTMGVLHAEKIIDYISDPLRRCLRDDNPYVRKTAALCIAKLYDMKPELAVENGFIEMLKEMEIEDTASEESGDKGAIFSLNSSILAKLLVAIGECTEWGRIALLSAIAKYRAVDEKEAEHICERVMPQFQHANPSVVLAAVKVILIHIRYVTREDFVKSTMRKMAPPLVTLVSSPPEIQWVALRNINLILQQNPNVLSNEIRVFFCKYNDPAYVKLEKLDIMVKLSNEKNVDTLLSELKEYASEVDYDFVKKAIRAIGLVAIKIDNAAEKCVNVLLELISTKVSYVVQEAIIVIKDIFRKYPQRYEGIIPTLCSNLEDLDEPEAKASLIWILGEYAEKIDNADELLNTFLSNFQDETVVVQIQILTAIVKLYLKKPDSSQHLVQNVLQNATKNCDNPDIRDRAYIYWRLLSTDPEAAKSVVLAQRPLISIPLSTISPSLLDELTHEIGTLASVYHKPAEAFIGRGRVGADELSRKEAREGLPEGMVSASAAAAAAANAIQVVAQGQRSENLLDFGLDDEEDQQQSASLNSTPNLASSSTAAATNNNAFNNNALFGLDFGAPSPAIPTSSSTSSYASPAISGMTSNAQAKATPTARPSNTLDDLLGVFDQAGLGPGSSNGGIIGGGGATQMNNTMDLFGGSSGAAAGNGLGSGMMSPTASAGMRSPPPPQQQHKQNDDLMGDLF
ncbi:Adaptor protein complex beta subunit [Cystobasidium minutum MCA 4210]|uniref:Adaptor protein complex beta subunit n=1 Tax=Cystobasidium minutum MCA 4210 TaxID=1397322 RepID=UPI0034CF0C9C|eukprot:jgi/Rhomi1/87335/CE87334_963